ncbi:respiratory nitrate reductase subunit gamma [Desulfofustis limnaeus]|jgi:nitrate reductase gamma subunit|uniref:Nitrate reductase gamma chain n=1 Tax=Desulfofustis limnaeus TaxID=2740163 RepID=A0ABN6M996_9BACT|nr:respiratory nitrate reductase subunit gamma [Desulfofustis limnaeus]MDX9895111.1 respiratory nitrate reductase subunit gamma [Desulfofustis sp.]BDD88123.1 nitrate reductase gamma chain [Desulfofustis limnaeus]
MIDLLLFAILPYVAMTLALAGGLYRYVSDRYSWSAQSSQFLEGRVVFWGTVPWHYAILLILLAHFLAFLVPQVWGTLLGVPLRLMVLEATGIALGLVTVAAMVVLLLRRLLHPRIKRVTTWLDWLVLLVLLVQVGSGVWLAVTLRWGGLWYMHTMTPWLWSLVTFAPDITYPAVMPFVVKMHVTNSLLLVALFPFTRLVHLVSVPLSYLFRPFQIVIWNKRSNGC